MITDRLLAELEKYADPAGASFLQNFFKTGDGQYGAGDGDVFIGVSVPQIRLVAKQFKGTSLAEVEELLESPVHEVRLCAVIIMTLQAKKASDAEAKDLYDLYLRRTDRINNWDIVDTSCRLIVGQYAVDHPERTDDIRRLAKSDDIWERRIAMVSTWQFIRLKQLDLTFEIAGQLLGDTHDLIHKAVGWMLREAGKRDADRLRGFLVEHAGRMPRTALRYAIERFDPEERQYFLKLR
jgi:3-methyladenine DNA glycosylase AlkD